MTSLFNQSDRQRTKPEPESDQRLGTEKKEEGTKMKKFGFATVIASGLAAAMLGLARSPLRRV